MRKCSSGFFVFWFTVNDHRVTILSKLLGTVPYLFNKRTGCVIFLNFNAFVEEEVFDFDRCPEGWNDDDIVGEEIVPGNELFPVSIHDEADAAALKIVVDLLVMNHLAKEEYTLVRIFFEGTVADLNRVLDTVTKTKMAGEIKLNRAEVEQRGREVLFAQVFRTARFFYLTGD